MTSRKKFNSRRHFLVGSALVAALCPAARAGTALISVTPNFPMPNFDIGEEVSPCGDKEGLHGSRAIVIGMAYNPEGTCLDGWWFLLTWTHIPEFPSLQGQADADFWHESQIRSLSQ